MSGARACYSDAAKLELIDMKIMLTDKYGPAIAANVAADAQNSVTVGHFGIVGGRNGGDVEMPLVRRQVQSFDGPGLEREFIAGRINPPRLQSKITHGDITDRRIGNRKLPRPSHALLLRKSGP